MKLKVFSGMTFVVGGNQVRTVIATTSRKKLAKALNCSLYEAVGWWSITGNKEEVTAAMTRPETILVRNEQWRGDFMTVEEYKAKHKPTAP